MQQTFVPRAPKIHPYSVTKMLTNCFAKLPGVLVGLEARKTQNPRVGEEIFWGPVHGHSDIEMPLLPPLEEKLLH
jgi:hypothetical protein